MSGISLLLKWLVALAAILAGAGLIVILNLPMKSSWARKCIAGFAGCLFAPWIPLSLLFGFGLIAASSAQAQLSTLYTFTGTNGDGANPRARLMTDSAGNLYGTTPDGGTGSACPDNCGTVFELVYSSGSYSKQILYSFTGTEGDGWNPEGGLIMDSAGNLYGTTYWGGTSSACGGVGCGTVFELVYSSGSYSEQILYSFTGTQGDGAGPAGSLIMDPAGNLYGTTQGGGTGTGSACRSGCGTVFELESTSPEGIPGYGYERVLYSFTGTDGDGVGPSSGGLVFDSAYNLYGTTTFGGAGGCSLGCGTVFVLFPTIENGSLQPNYSEEVLYSFTGTDGDGYYPEGGLIVDSAGSLYGTTGGGGTGTSSVCSGGCGTAFELIHSNRTYTETILHNFTATDGDGYIPSALIVDSAGNLYGTTDGGGTSNACGAIGCGTVFELVYPSYLEGVLHSFTNADGADPQGGLILDSAGNLYGTTYSGGTGNTTNDVCGPPIAGAPSSYNTCDGTVFKLAKPTNPPSGPDCSGVFYGIHDGPIEVLPSTVCEFAGGEIDGNIEMSGGTLVLSNTRITGNVQVTGASTFSMSLSTVIQGNLQVQNTSLSTALDVVCGTTINGNLQFQDSATGLDLGSPTVCPDNTIGGSLQVQNNSGAAQILDITVNGNLQVQNNNGSTQVNGNTVSGNVQVQNNTASTQIDSNTVGGNLQVQNNNGSTQVFSNTVTGNLQCENNASITGGGNTASQKQGQCSNF